MTLSKDRIKGMERENQEKNLQDNTIKINYNLRIEWDKIRAQNKHIQKLNYISIRGLIYDTNKLIKFFRYLICLLLFFY